MNMLKELFVDLGLVTLTVCFMGCGHSGGEAGGDGSLGSLAVGLATSGGDHDVDAIRLKVVNEGSACADPGVLQTVQPLEEEALPAHVVGADSQHAFADGLFVLPPAKYKVCALPLRSDGKRSKHCHPATANAVVHEGETTEIVIVSQCEGDPAGALDVIVALNAPPEIDDLGIEPSKFISRCETASITVATSDPDGDDLTFEWGIAVQPPGDDAVLLPDGASAEFEPGAAGEYELLVVVKDVFGGVTELRFPIHVTDVCVLQAVADSHVRTDLDIRRNDNHGCQQYLEIGTSRGGGGSELGDADAMRAMIQFDVSGVPDGAQVESAVLELTLWGYESGLPSSTQYTVDVHPIVGSGTLTPWQEGDGVEYESEGVVVFPPPEECINVDAAEGVAWVGAGDGGDDNNQTQPAFGPAVAASAIIEQATHVRGDVIDWDITQLVRDWVDGSAVNYGMMLTDTTTDGSFRTVRFGSREPTFRSFPAEQVVDAPRLVVKLAP